MSEKEYKGRDNIKDAVWEGGCLFAYLLLTLTCEFSIVWVMCVAARVHASIWYRLFNYTSLAYLNIYTCSTYLPA